MSTRTFDRRALEAQRFEGWVRFRDLPTSKAPTGGGVYVIYRAEVGAPIFLERSPAGHFKGQDPSAPIAELERNWVSAAHVMYVGMTSSDLRGRLNTYRRFGQGSPVGHRGGRYIWQLADSDRLLVAWRTESDPATIEATVLREFLAQYGSLPFANLNAGRTLPSEPRARGATSRITPSAARPASTTFTIAGRAVTLSAQDVCDALRGVTPEPVLVWAVEVDGRMYPVVQVLERASGVPRSATRSARARDVLSALGFRLIRV